MMDGNLITAVFLLAFLAEALTEYFVAEPLGRVEDGRYVWLCKYVAAIVGVGLCIIYKIDLLLMAFGMSATSTWAAWILSGVIIGRGSNFVNDIIDFIRVKAPVLPGHDVQ
jgi:hypothetical protein